MQKANPFVIIMCGLVCICIQADAEGLIGKASNKNTLTKQWQNILFVRDRIKNNPRPINNTKNYGADEAPPQNDYQKRVWHRNESNGLGLTEPAQECIKALRKLESLVKMWELAPGNDLLTDYEESKVFLSADPGRKYVLFFMEGGSATLNLTEYRTMGIYGGTRILENLKTLLQGKTSQAITLWFY